MKGFRLLHLTSPFPRLILARCGPQVFSRFGTTRLLFVSSANAFLQAQIQLTHSPVAWSRLRTQTAVGTPHKEVARHAARASPTAASCALPYRLRPALRLSYFQGSPWCVDRMLRSALRHRGGIRDDHLMPRPRCARAHSPIPCSSAASRWRRARSSGGFNEPGVCNATRPGNPGRRARLRRLRVREDQQDLPIRRAINASQP
jgi:hypothetical protein